MENSSFWIIGAMPVQLLLVLAGVFVLFLAGQFLLKKIGRPVPAFGQAVLIPAAAYAVFKWVVYPPLPSTLIAVYMGLVLLVTFLMISSTERLWSSFKGTIFDTLLGRTFGHRVARVLTVFLIPIGIGLFAFQTIAPPVLETPAELRIIHPAPPSSITVYPPEYFSQNKP